MSCTEPEGSVSNIAWEGNGPKPSGLYKDHELTLTAWSCGDGDALAWR